MVLSLSMPDRASMISDLQAGAERRVEVED
jgi:hypothetical protein